MTWLVFLFAFEAGIAPNIEAINYNQPMECDIIEWGVFYTDLSCEVVLWDTLFAGGGVRTYVVPSHGIHFSPRNSVFDFTAGLQWRMLEVGWRHRCFHPMMPYSPILEVHGIEGGYDELYFRIEGRF